MQGLVFVEGNEVFTTSIEIAKGVNHSHTSVLRLIQNSMDLEIFNTLKVKKVATKGRPSDVYYLTEEQATLLIALMRNTPVVRVFKNNLVREFYKQRRMIESLASQRNNAEWLNNRQETKVVRQECTDVIQEFVAYAKEQGSKSADHYYSNLSRMELSGLFILEKKYPNARDVMSMRQLNLIEMADEAVAVSLRDSMDAGLPYKECYQQAKIRIELLAKIIPRSPLPALLRDSKATCELDLKEVEES